MTQSQYEKVMGNNPGKFRGATLPIENISYSDAETFCKKAGNLAALTMRLPTEAEWEYACRAGARTRFNTGDNTAALELAGWFDGNAGGQTHPVGQKKMNAWGLYDMHGNVWQWCQDWSADDYYAKAAPIDPSGPAQGAGRVLRGGSWDNNAAGCRVTGRHGENPDGRFPSVGFRVVTVLAIRAPVAPPMASANTALKAAPPAQPGPKVGPPAPKATAGPDDE